MNSPLAEKSIFLTGSCGFLGKLILEKILLLYPDVGQIYLLIREKNFNPQERLDRDILASPVFDSIRKVMPDFDKYAHGKLKVVKGDLRQPSLGIYDDLEIEDLKSVSVVIHCAALSDFNAPLDAAVLTNVNGTEGLLRFTYVNALVGKLGAKRSTIEEKMYPLNYPVHKIAHVSQQKGNWSMALTEKLKKQYANTQAFTKALSEHILVQNSSHVPHLIIIRPSLIGSTYRHPYPGWTEKLSVVGSLFLYTGLGLVNIVQGDPNRILDIVPADYVVNRIVNEIISVEKELPRKLPVSHNPPRIIHVATSSSNPLRWGYATQTVTSYWLRNPPRKGTGPPSLSIIPSYAYYRHQFITKYEAPTTLYSFIANLSKSPIHERQAHKLRKMIAQSRQLLEKLSPYLENEWIFQTSEHDQASSQSVVSNSGGPKEVVPNDFSCSSIDWHSYINYYCYGIQKYILCEKVDLPKARELAFDRDAGQDILQLDRDVPFGDVRFALFTSYSVRTPNSTRQEQTTVRSNVLKSSRLATAIKYISEDVAPVLKNRKKDGIPLSISEADIKAAMMTPVQMRKYCGETLTTLSATMNLTTMRPIGYLFRKIWQRLYKQINVNNSGLEKIKELTKSGAAIVYMPSHRSYIDFLIMSYILFTCHLPLPHIAAGEDFLGIKYVCNILRSGGAFFLKRSFRGDSLYTSLFTEYVQQLLAMGCPLEFFIEGTRSRSGKCIKPKLGLLGMITDSYFNGSLPDIYFVPVHVNYERVVEADIYPSELLGIPKRKESLGGLIDARYVLEQDFGRISVKISEPISLAEYVQGSRTKVLNTLSRDSEFNPANNIKQRKLINEFLGNSIIYAISEKTVYSAVSMVSSILLTFRYGVKQDKLLAMLAWLQNEIIQYKGGCFDWLLSENPHALLVKGIDHLQNAVYSLMQGRFYRVDADPESWILCSTYRNKIVHAFFQEAAVLIAVVSLASERENEKDADNTEESTVKGTNLNPTIGDVVTVAHFLEDLLFLEVIFKDDPEKETDYVSVIEELVQKNILCYDNERRIIVSIDSEEERTTSKCSNSDIVMFYCHLLYPFIESYWVTGKLISHISPNGTPVSALLERALWLAKHLAGQGQIFSHESCSKETLNNALHLFHRWGLLEKRRIPVGKMTMEKRIDPAMEKSDSKTVQRTDDSLSDKGKSSEDNRKLLRTEGNMVVPKYHTLFFLSSIFKTGVSSPKYDNRNPLFQTLNRVDRMFGLFSSYLSEDCQNHQSNMYHLNNSPLSKLLFCVNNLRKMTAATRTNVMSDISQLLSKYPTASNIAKL